MTAINGRIDEATAMAALEAAYREMGIYNQAFTQQMGPFGFTAPQLAAHLNTLTGFQKRFIDFGALAAGLSSGREAFLNRLAAIQNDVNGCVKIVGEMYSSTLATDRRIAGINEEANRSTFETMQQINENMRKSYLK